jgi:hypothetical protein
MTDALPEPGRRSSLGVLVPTRGRPGNIEKVISAWDFTNAWDHADLILIADSDDPEIGGYRRVVESFTAEAPEGTSAVKLVEMDEWMPMVHKLNLVAKLFADVKAYRALAFAGDDHLPQTIGWARVYLAELAELGTGMVYGDDGYQGRKLSTEWAVTADAVRALGRMVPAPVEHMYCDNSMMDLYGGAGAMKHLPEIRIEHMHPVAGKAKTDEQYQRVNHRDQFSKDRTAYMVWREGQTLGMQIAAVRELRPGMPEIRPAAEPKSGRPARPAVARSGRSTRLGIRGGLGMKPPRFFKRVQAATPDDIMMALADFAAAVPADQEIVELGVFHGRTALQMAWGARQGHGAHVTGIDPWDLPGNVYDPPFTDEASRRWAFHHVVALGYAKDITLVHAFSHEVAAAYDGKPVGLLFVDGDHTKDGAKRDIVEWAPYLAPGARIAVDDYGHPDWPGVGEAVDELVAEGFLAPIQIFHDRLAVTEIAAPPERVRAITAEGVSTSPVRNFVPMATSPEPPFLVDVELAPGDDDALSTDALAAEWERVDPEGVAALRESAAALTGRERVQAGEVEGIAAGTKIEDLNTVQLRQLARAREIVLGTRKDKRSEMLDALRSGQ